MYVCRPHVTFVVVSVGGWHSIIFISNNYIIIIIVIIMLSSLLSLFSSLLPRIENTMAPCSIAVTTCSTVVTTWSIIVTNCIVDHHLLITTPEMSGWLVICNMLSFENLEVITNFPSI